LLLVVVECFAEAFLLLLFLVPVGCVVHELVLVCCDELVRCFLFDAAATGGSESRLRFLAVAVAAAVVLGEVAMAGGGLVVVVVSPPQLLLPAVVAAGCLVAKNLRISVNSRCQTSRYEYLAWCWWSIPMRRQAGGWEGGGGNEMVRGGMGMRSRKGGKVKSR
jgi:hypothetical protein